MAYKPGQTPWTFFSSAGRSSHYQLQVQDKSFLFPIPSLPTPSRTPASSTMFSKTFFFVALLTLVNTATALNYGRSPGNFGMYTTSFAHDAISSSVVDAGLTQVARDPTRPPRMKTSGDRVDEDSRILEYYPGLKREGVPNLGNLKTGWVPDPRVLFVLTGIDALRY